MSQRTTAHNAVQFASGHTSKNTDLLKEALDTMGMRTNGSNQRLAMLGDALPKIVLLDSWYAGGTAKGNGNNRVSSIRSNANLAIVGRDAGIDQHAVLPPGHIGRISDKTLATTIEAILGAVYLDTSKEIKAVSRTMAVLGLST